MYKKYIIKKGKKIGPYYYDSVRLKNGKVKSIYLGSDLRKAKINSSKLKKLHSKGKVSSSATKTKFSFEKPHVSLVKIEEGIFVALIVAMLLFGFIYFENIGSADGDLSGSFFQKTNLITGNFADVTGSLIFSEKEDEIKHHEIVNLVVNASSEFSFDITGVEKLKGVKINGKLIGNLGEGNVKVFLENKEYKIMEVNLLLILNLKNLELIM